MDDKKYWTERPDANGYWSDGAQELGLDDLEGVAGGAGSSSGMVESDGTVLGCIGNGVFQVNVDGQTVNASMSGKLRMNYIRITDGDIVRVEYSPDTLKGRITWRYK